MGTSFGKVGKFLFIVSFSVITLILCQRRVQAQTTAKPAAYTTLDYPLYGINDVAVKDSLIVVITRQESDFIKVFSNSHYLTSFGKTGPGPYEFKSAQSVCALSDRIVVLDFRLGNSKLVSFSYQGLPIKEIPLRGVQMAEDLSCRGRQKVILAGVFMSQKKRIILAETGKEIFSYSLPDDIKISPSRGVMNNLYITPSFAPRFHWDLTDSNKLIFWNGTDNKLYEVTFVKDTVNAITLARHSIELETVDIKLWLLKKYPPGTVAFGRQNFYRGVREEILSTVAFPDFFPLVLDIKQDSKGGIWILKAEKKEGQIWVYHKPDGEYITVSFPPDHDIMAFGEQWIVAKVESNGIESVELFKRSEIIKSK